MGITNDKVFPEPVTAYQIRERDRVKRDKRVSGENRTQTSTTTSLLPIKIGMTEAWTGVICS